MQSLRFVAVKYKLWQQFKTQKYIELCKQQLFSIQILSFKLTPNLTDLKLGSSTYFFLLFPFLLFIKIQGIKFNSE